MSHGVVVRLVLRAASQCVQSAAQCLLVLLLCTVALGAHTLPAIPPFTASLPGNTPLSLHTTSRVGQKHLPECKSSTTVTHQPTLRLTPSLVATCQQLSLPYFHHTTWSAWCTWSRGRPTTLPVSVATSHGCVHSCSRSRPLMGKEPSHQAAHAAVSLCVCACPAVRDPAMPASHACMLWGNTPCWHGARALAHNCSPAQRARSITQTFHRRRQPAA